MSNNGAIIDIKKKRVKRSATMAITRIVQTGRLVLTRSVDINKPATANSRINTGSIGGAIGGIPVKIQDIVGEIMIIRSTYFQVRNILPTIRGMNMGRNAGPNPRK
jgi:translation initiation factor 2 gamma subunit (eIF-2gamma)